MVTIYIRNKPLYLVEKIEGEIEDYLHRQDTIFIDELNPPAIKTMLHEMEQDTIYRGVFLHPNVDELLAAFKQHLNVIIAAGGFVYTPEHDILLIHRLGHWDLPKGKLDDGEEIDACALREINEETGATGLSIEKSLHITYHTYYQNGKNNLKESYWFLVKVNERMDLTPQTEENIAKCVWVPLNELQPYIDSSFASIAEVLKKGMDALQASSK